MVGSLCSKISSLGLCRGKKCAGMCLTNQRDFSPVGEKAALPPSTSLTLLVVVFSLIVLVNVVGVLVALSGTSLQPHKVFFLPGITDEVEKIEVPAPPPPFSLQNQAFVVVMTNDHLISMLFTLEASFKDVNSTRRRIVLCTPAVTAEARDTLSRLGMELRDIEQPYHKNFRVDVPRWKDTLAKFAIFLMDDLEKFVYFDVDYVLVDNVDYLFDLPTNSTVTAMVDGIGCRADDLGMNAGLIIAAPNRTLYNELFAMLDAPNAASQTHAGDQQMLNNYLLPRNMLRFLPEQEATFLWRCICVEQQKISPFIFEKVKAVHFTGFWLKPDELLESGKPTWPELCGIPWYNRWLNMYEAGFKWWEERHPQQELKLTTPRRPGLQVHPPPKALP